MSAIEEFLALPAEEQEEKIKRLLHETIHEGEPAVKEAAYDMGLSPFTLYKWGSTESEKAPRLRQLIHLLHLKQNLKILDFLNNLFGLLTFPKPRSLESLEEISRHITRVFKEASAACQAIIDSVEPDSRGGMEIPAAACGPGRSGPEESPETPVLAAAVDGQAVQGPVIFFGLYVE
jgi:hypothetical protein